MAYFTINPQKKVITLDTKVFPTQVEKDAAQMYVNAGYTVRFKSEKRAASARKRAKERGGVGNKAKAE